MAAKEWKLDDFERVLVVEGHDDRIFYAEMLEVVGKHGQVFIHVLGGKQNLKNELEVLITPTLLERKKAMAFVIDADAAPIETKASLQTLLSRLTNQAVVNDQWTQGSPKIGLLIVPGNDAKGEIETLVWHAWASNPGNAGQKKCIEDYMACMKASNASAHSPDKGLIGGLLAVKNDDDPRLGPGARANVFDLNSPQLQMLRNFLAGF
jgi:hypothetical protein